MCVLYLSNFFSALANNYKLHCCFYGHVNPINTLAVSYGAMWLASGGTVPFALYLFFQTLRSQPIGGDGVRFWDIATGIQIGQPHQYQALRPQPCVSTFAYQHGIDRYIYGMARGYIIICVYDATQVCITFKTLYEPE